MSEDASPSSRLLRRITLWVPVPVLALEAFVFAFLGAKFFHYFQIALGGVPLPLLTSALLGHAVWFYVLPAVSFGVAACFSLRATLSVSQTLLICALDFAAVIVVFLLFWLSLAAPMMAVISGMHG